MQPVDLSEMMESPGCFTGAKSEGKGAATLDREGSRPSSLQAGGRREAAPMACFQISTRGCQGRWEKRLAE